MLMLLKHTTLVISAITSTELDSGTLFLGWIYDSGTWYKWGLSDTAPITSGRFSGETHYGIGIAPDAANRMKISGNVHVTGDIDVTGKYGCADKYSLATGINNGNNGVMYTGNGSTTSFAISLVIMHIRYLYS